jgi:chromosome segregation ATPase
MSNIGRTVRASFQLKDQLEAIVTTRLDMIKRIDDRLRNGIFDPEADLRDLDEYLKNSIGRGSQDLIANRERLVRMDNQLELWQRELKLKQKARAWVEGKQKETQDKLDIEDHKPEDQKCASCIASLAQELASYEILKGQLESEITNLRCQIENRVKQYNIQMQERVRFGEQVQSMNEAWSQFNNSLDELQRALSKVN